MFVGIGELVALEIVDEGLRHRIGAHAEGRLAHFLARDFPGRRRCR